MKYHANAKLTLRARRDLVERMLAGWSASDVADQMNVSPATVYKWWRSSSEQRALHHHHRAPTPSPTTSDYVARRTAEGLSKREIIRCLKRYIAREVFAALPRSHETAIALHAA